MVSLYCYKKPATFSRHSINSSPHHRTILRFSLYYHLTDRLWKTSKGVIQHWEILKKIRKILKSLSVWFDNGRHVIDAEEASYLASNSFFWMNMWEFLELFFYFIITFSKQTSFSFVLHGSLIKASINHRLIRYYKNILKECVIYHIINFDVVKNNGK